MKNNRKNRKHVFGKSAMAIVMAMALMFCAFGCGLVAGSGSVASADTTTVPTNDPSPAISVVQKTANSVVGISSYVQSYNQSTREVSETLYSQGSGVVIAEGGYVLTNYHVIESCTAFKVLMPDGEYVDADVTGSDSSTDLAVLQVKDRADELVPVTIGTTEGLPVGSTVIAIGNPGGEVLANTVTQGIISALERNVEASNTTRSIKYIQHSAAINSGNSGGGLFDIDGNLIGINTLKYSGSSYSSVSFEGLGFAIPVDTAYPIAKDLIEYGQVLRPQMGVTVTAWDGPDEPLAEYPPASVMVYSVNEGSPAEAAGLQAYDFITEIDGTRVTTLAELTTVLDQHNAGDVVTLTVVRYSDLSSISSNYSSSTNSGTDIFGGSNGSNAFGGRYSKRTVTGVNTYETLTFEVTLELPEIEK